MAKPHVHKPPKHPKPPRVRAKVGLAKAKAATKLDISSGYVIAQANNDPQGKLAPEATTLSTRRASLLGLLGTQATLKVQKDANDAAVVVAFAAHDQATMDYAHAAAEIAAGDASLLSTLGVAAATSGVKGAKDAVGMPVLVLGPGTNDGELLFKCKAIAHAGAYMFEYKLEPSLPTDPWLPQGGIITKHARTTVTGLAPEQAVRGRARAVGGAPGPWSAEVVGKAK